MMQSSSAFCPVCSRPLERRYIAEEGRERLVCSDGHILYENPNIVAGTIPVSDGKVWMLRRGIEPQKGYWTFPSGFMELGETVEEAAARETLEEICLDVEITGLIGVYSRPVTSIVFIVYLAKAEGQAAPGDESLEVQTFSPDEIPWDELAFWSTRVALEDWIGKVESAGLKR